ncbi:MAG: PQQ-binding-like beta-propeller repeat protein [Pirellula sp.]
MPSNESRENASIPRWCFFVLPLGLGLCLSAVVVVARWLQEDTGWFFLIGLDGLLWWIATGAIIALACVVSILYFRLRARTVAGLSVAILLMLLTLSRVIRVEGYYGDRTPRWTWRWKPTAEQQIKEYLTSKKSTAPDAHTVDALTVDASPSIDVAVGCLLGPERDGRIPNVELDTQWEIDPPKLLWRHPVGFGWSSIAVQGKWAISLEQRDAEECVVCYNVRTGEELWHHAEETRFQNQYGDGPRTTPSIAGDKVVSLGATGVLTCLELRSGQVVWRRSVFENAESQNLLFGMAGSPLVYDNKVVVTPGAGTNASAMCFSLENGEELWQCGSDEASYASPSLVELSGIRQILSFNGEGLRSYGLDGTELWLHPWITQGESKVNVAQPIVVDRGTISGEVESASKILISSGYDRGTALLNVECREGIWTTTVVWSSHQLKSKLSNFVVSNDHIYGLDNGLLTCLSLASGERQWKRGRYGHGKLLLVGTNLLIQAESGEVVVVAADPAEHRELSKIPALDGKTWNYPTLAGRILVVRNDHEAAAFELPLVALKDE